MKLDLAAIYADFEEARRAAIEATDRFMLLATSIRLERHSGAMSSLERKLQGDCSSAGWMPKQRTIRNIAAPEIHCWVPGRVRRRDHTRRGARRGGNLSTPVVLVS